MAHNIFRQCNGCVPLLGDAMYLLDQAPSFNIDALIEMTAARTGEVDHGTSD